ncbi:MAG: DivIVA domain-containing protein [Candidatus Howiella sp.]|jgi:DivIVA domain-containing protein
MYSAEKIRNAEIKKSAFGGYHMDEVDDLLDAVADDFAKLEQEKAEAEARLAILSEKLEGYRTSENSIHTALLNAQRLADQTVKEASEAAGHTTTEAAKKAELVVSDAEAEAEEILAEAGRKADAIVADAIAKTESMIAAAHDSVARQQMLFDRLKVETKNLRDSLLQKYKRQITFVESLPDEVPFDAERAAEVLTFAFDSVPDYEAMAAAARPKTDVDVRAVIEHARAAASAADEAETSSSGEEKAESLAAAAETAEELQPELLMTGADATDTGDTADGGFVVNTDIEGLE